MAGASAGRDGLRSQLFVIPAALCAAVLVASFMINEMLQRPAMRGQTEGSRMFVLAQAINDSLAVTAQEFRQRDIVGFRNSLRQLRALNHRVRDYAVPEFEILGALELLRESALERPELLEQLQLEGGLAARRLVLRGQDLQGIVDQRRSSASDALVAVLACGLLLALAGLRWANAAFNSASSAPNSAAGPARPLPATDLAELLMQDSHESICIVDAEGVILRVNNAYCELTGYSSTEAVGQALNFNIAPRPGQLHADPSPVYGEAWQGESWRRHKNGEAYIEHASLQPLRAANGDVQLLLVRAQGVGSGRAVEQLIRWQANHDALTKLPTRGLFLDRLTAALEQGGQRCGVALIDIDRFKHINDSFGYAAGDQILIQISNRLALAGRAQDRIARLDGDRFAVLLAAPLRDGEQTSVVRAILDRIAQSFEVDGREAFLSVSIGVAMAPGDAQQANGLMHAAERALELVKSRGGNGFRFFEAEMHAAAGRRVAIEQGLRRAVAMSQLTMHYQPIVDVIDPAVHGVEALLRWHHPSLGDVSPAEFIPIAEQCGLMVPIGLWILETVCTQIDLWLAADIDNLRVNVNVSGYQLRTADARAALCVLLTGRHAARLCLEITESVLIENSDDTRRFLEQVRAAGVRVAIDDFGTGFSSLGYLLHFPIDVVKIDKSFIDHMETDNKALALVATIEAMGRILGMQVVAEGVETERQLDRLRIVGSRLVQGYLFARPMSGGDITRLMQIGHLNASEQTTRAVG